MPLKLYFQDLAPLVTPSVTKPYCNVIPNGVSRFVRELARWGCRPARRIQIKASN